MNARGNQAKASQETTIDLKASVKLWCLDQAINITIAHASSESPMQSPDIVLRKSYFALVKLRELADEKPPAGKTQGAPSRTSSARTRAQGDAGK